MKNRILLSFLTLGISLFANRGQDIDIVLEKSFFPQNDQGKMMIEMNATSLLQESDKNMDTSELVNRFFEKLDFSNYHHAFDTFSDEELHSLALIFTDPAYIKMMTEGYQVFTAIQQQEGEELRAIIDREGTYKPAPITLDTEFEVVDLTRENFFETVIMAKKPMIIDFSGKHCRPCHLLAPIFEKLNAEFGDRLLFIRLECNDAPEIAKHFNVRGIPTLLFLKPNGAFPEVIKSKVGFSGEENLREEIVQFLSGLEN